MRIAVQIEIQYDRNDLKLSHALKQFIGFTRFYWVLSITTVYV